MADYAPNMGTTMPGLTQHITASQQAALGQIRVSANAYLRSYVPVADIRRLEEFGMRLQTMAVALRLESQSYLEFASDYAWTILNRVYYSDIPKGHRKPTLYRDQWGQSVSIAYASSPAGPTVKLFANIAYAELLGGHTGPRGPLSQSEQRRIEWWMAQKMGMKNNKVIRAVIHEIEETGMKGPSPFAAAFGAGSAYGRALDEGLGKYLDVWLNALIARTLGR